MDEDRHIPSAGAAGDREIDLVLGFATVPTAPEGAMSRLMARIEAEPQAGKVAAFAPRRHPRRPVWRYAAAVPLAASLALGIWLGASGRMDFMMPGAITGGVALNDDVPVDDLGGMADAYAEEGTT